MFAMVVADLILVRDLVRSVARLILISCIVMLAACASGPPDLPPGSGFPRQAEVDPRLNLTGSDRVQIARLVAQETSEPINAVTQGQNPSKILVTCGKVNLVHPTQWTKGAGFIMQRSASSWKIISKAEINIVPQNPTLSPVEKSAW